MKHEYIRNYEGIGKDTIFDRTMKWIAQNFKSAKQVIDYEDKGTGTIIAKGMITYMDLGGLASADLSFTLSIDIKENKARYIFTHLIPMDPYSGEEITEMSDYERVHTRAKKKFDIMIEQISIAINTVSDF